MDKAQPSYQPGGPPLTQYGRMRRQRVMKELRRGRPLVAEDLPVAAALVDQQRSRKKWYVALSCFWTVSFLFQGVQDHGFMRWAMFGLVIISVVALALQLREQRQLIRNYEGQVNTADGGSRRHDVAS
jgi:hypothetical protein